jgi:hypothetical protein
MFSKLLFALLLMSACVVLHASGLTAIFRWTQARLTRGPRIFRRDTAMLVRFASWTVLLHLGEILLWAVLYFVGGAMKTFTTATYFSAVTYTTTGYGDLVLPEEWRLAGSVEALTGILMCGLSTGLFFAGFSKIFLSGGRLSREKAETSSP